MKKILFVGQKKNSASFRYRVSLYVPLLKKDNYCSEKIFISNSIFKVIKLLIIAKNFNIIFIQRKLLPRPIFFILRLLSKIIIFDFDDSIFLNSKGKFSKTRDLRFKFIVRNSDLIFAGNNFLVKKAKKINKNSHLINTCLDIKKYRYLKKNQNIINLIWIGSKSTYRYLKEIIPYLYPLKKHNKKIQLINVSDVVINDFTLPIENIKWSEENEIKYLAKSHIGLAPLGSDIWCKGKCSLKLLQYFAAGIPVISSNYGMNKEIVKESKFGYLAKNNNDWIRYINLIIYNNDYTYYKKQTEKYINKFDITVNYEKVKNLIIRNEKN